MNHGYARNKLYPNQVAVPSTAANREAYIQESQVTTTNECECKGTWLHDAAFKTARSRLQWYYLSMEMNCMLQACSCRDPSGDTFTCVMLTVNSNQLPYPAGLLAVPKKGLCFR